MIINRAKNKISRWIKPLTKGSLINFENSLKLTSRIGISSDRSNGFIFKTVRLKLQHSILNLFFFKTSTSLSITSPACDIDNYEYRRWKIFVGWFSDLQRHTYAYKVLLWRVNFKSDKFNGGGAKLRRSISDYRITFRPKDFYQQSLGIEYKS